MLTKLGGVVVTSESPPPPPQTFKTSPLSFRSRHDFMNEISQANPSRFAQKYVDFVNENILRMCIRENDESMHRAPACVAGREQGRGWGG